MKFVCDHCQTRYRISDEKVRGKVLKIRCKTCSNIVVVREETAIDESAQVEAKKAVGARGPVPRTEAEFAGAQRKVPAAPDTTEWFVAIKGSQHGPMNKDEVEALYSDEKISGRSYCWHENLKEWTRLRDLTDFKTLTSKEPDAKKPPPPPPDEKGADVVDLQKAREKKRGKKAAADPFGQVADAPIVKTSAGTNSLRESTRVFIMNAGLANRKTKHRAYGAIAAVFIATIAGLGFLDWKGVIQIPLLHSAISVVAETAGVAEPEIRKEIRIKTELDDLEAKLLRCELADLDCPEVKSNIAKVKKKSKRYAAKAPDIKVGKGIADIGADAFQTGGGKPSSPDNMRAKGPSGELAALSGSGPGDLFKDDLKKKFKPKAKFDTPTLSGGVGLSSEQISSVLKANRGAIESCIAQNAKTSDIPKGKQFLVLSIEATGKVSKARFSNRAVQATPVGRCITQRARGWRFASFTGEAFDVDIPLVLGLS